MSGIKPLLLKGSSDPVPELLFGDPVITETLFYLSFSISPQVLMKLCDICDLLL